MTGDPYVIAVTQRKGGDGKTTIATHVAAGLALKGARVCLIDTDSQGDAARLFGMRPDDGLYRWMGQGVDLSEVLTPVPESAPAQKFYVRPMTPEESREFYAAREKYYAENGYQTTSVTVPRPSATELKLRKASYKAIRDGLTNALTGGRSLIPVLDGLEATDPYLSGTDKDGPR